MKTKLFILICLIFAFTLNAQEIKLPKKVKDTFTKLYPKATEVKWDEEGDEEFEAGFVNEGVKTSVVINDEGEVLEIETVIKVTDLSKAIHDFVAKNYAGYEVTEAAKIVDSKGVVTFEAEVTKGKEKKDLIFDKDGNEVVKAKKESEEDEDDEEESEEH